MFGIVALNPTGGTVPLTLKVDEVSRSTVDLACNAVPEAVKLRHDSRHALVQLAYEFDSISITSLQEPNVSGRRSL